MCVFKVLQSNTLDTRDEVHVRDTGYRYHEDIDIQDSCREFESDCYLKYENGEKAIFCINVLLYIMLF